MVITDIEEYVPDNDWAALKAAGRYADSHQIALWPDTVLRIARVGDEHTDRDAAPNLPLLAAATPTASADQIIDGIHIARPAVRPNHTPRREVQVPPDAAHDQLLNSLRISGRVTRSTPRGKHHYKATVTGKGE